MQCMYAHLRCDVMSCFCFLHAMLPSHWFGEGASPFFSALLKSRGALLPFLDVHVCDGFMCLRLPASSVPVTHLCPVLWWVHHHHHHHLLPFRLCVQWFPCTSETPCRKWLPPYFGPFGDSTNVALFFRAPHLLGCCPLLECFLSFLWMFSPWPPVTCAPWCTGGGTIRLSCLPEASSPLFSMWRFFLPPCTPFLIK